MTSIGVGSPAGLPGSLPGLPCSGPGSPGSSAGSPDSVLVEPAASWLVTSVPPVGRLAMASGDTLGSSFNLP